MDVKGTLRAIALEFRRELEGRYDAHGSWQPGDLERRLAAIGERRDRAPVPMDELLHLAPEDREARRVIDAFLQSRADAGQRREAAIAEFVRDAAYTWANRLLALRCMEARSLIDEIILQKDAYGGRSLQHNRLAKKQPERCGGEDEGLFAVLFDEFARRTEELPLLFDPRSPEVALRPSVAALKRCVSLLSGTLAAKGQEPATDEVFTSPDSLGWAYQFYQEDEKSRVDEWLKTRKGFKCEGADLVPKTTLYTEPYMVKFLVQNSLGATWMAMSTESRLSEKWEYYVRDADRPTTSRKAVSTLTFLDPACGSGHFLIEAFELFYGMYIEEQAITEPAAICASILERNLYGIDIDERAVQIAALALVMKAKEKAPNFVPRRVNLVATNIRLPANKDHLEAFLRSHPEDAALKPALLAIFEGLAHADELGSLLQIEEPVEKELRALKAKYEEVGAPMEQQALWAELQKPVQGKLPVGVGSYEEWKDRALSRLREHLEAEMQVDELSAVFFGDNASRGVSLVELLSRRYDVVAANPPYLGSKNMGPVVKRFVERHFAQGKRDLYAAFILRCLELATGEGRVAMVTQQSWMFLRSFVDLRAPEGEKSGKASRLFNGVLRETSIETLAHLGRYAFSEIGNAAVAPVMFVLRNTKTPERHRLWACRLNAPRESHEQATLLRAATSERSSPLVFRPDQARFLTIPQSPLCYWLRETFFGLLAGRTVGEVADVRRGISTGDNNRLMRCHWEVPISASRWRPFVKGGGPKRWRGLETYAVDWPRGRVAMMELPGARIQNESYLDQAGATFSQAASGTLSLRLLSAVEVFEAKSPGVFPRTTNRELLLAVLNCRVASSVVRALSPAIDINEASVSRLPWPDIEATQLENAVQCCIEVSAELLTSSVTERAFRPIELSDSLRGAFVRSIDEAAARAAILSSLEGYLERRVVDAFGIAGDDLQAVLDETGKPAGWFPLIAGYDQLPELPSALVADRDVLEAVSHAERRAPAKDALGDLKQRLAAFYEAGLGATPEDPLSDDANNDEEDGDTAAIGGRIPIPAETFLEALAQRLQVHPISIYWLLRELGAKGVVSKPELTRFVEDYVSVIVLRLLGHRWRCGFEGESSHTWTDADGIIPLTEGMSQSTLLSRVRERIAEDFGSNRARAVEREFEEIVQRPLEAWLASEFFRRHISQFKKRPIAWQLTSSGGNSVKRRPRGAARNAPAFSCLVYYHRLDADLLPKLRTQYVGPLRASLQTELSSLERIRDRSADQDARRLELEWELEELHTFDARLEQVIVEAFRSPTLDKIAAKEPLEKWTSRDGRSRAPETPDALLVQERRYDPDPNDGVRLNIAPLQRAGLLAADVLAAKDVEKAIADRTEWRADERRWCREGKLPQPGWWASGGEG